MNKKKLHHPVDPQFHLQKVLMVAAVAIMAALFILFVRWISILDATQEIIITPAENGSTFLSRFIPVQFFRDVWEQQKYIWSLLTKGFVEALKSFGLQ